eukprot:TRINITY_DN30841_c0_g2_i1.p1 TRINITY_DN30841_c0_g2~~TRINITY_DN30841_c0_g2_i1.p1  ORF type:complete len:270 (+),score=29.27 TRINITY_DN30841_c0_g2_i1:95-811(+)
MGRMKQLAYGMLHVRRVDAVEKEPVGSRPMASLQQQRGHPQGGVRKELVQAQSPVAPIPPPRVAVAAIAAAPAVMSAEEAAAAEAAAAEAEADSFLQTDLDEAMEGEEPKEEQQEAAPFPVTVASPSRKRVSPPHAVEQDRIQVEEETKLDSSVSSACIVSTMEATASASAQRKLVPAEGNTELKLNCNEAPSRVPHSSGNDEGAWVAEGGSEGVEFGSPGVRRKKIRLTAVPCDGPC